MKSKSLYITVYYLLFLTLTVFAQKVEIQKLAFNENMRFAKIAWVTDNKTCIIADKNPSGNKFVHDIYIFDKAGNLTGTPARLKTTYSCQDQYFFSLGSTSFFLADDDDYKVHEFFIAGTLSENGILNDSKREIFSFRESETVKDLVEPKFNFNVFRGISSTNALLTYNNNYKDRNEGFMYRVLDSTGRLSVIDSVSLPYPDFLCNITDIIYDDEHKKIIMMCELYNSDDNKKRSFKNSLVAQYDISSGSYSEINLKDVSFEGSYIQHYVKNDKIGFSCISQIDRKIKYITFSSVLINRDSFTTANIFKQNLSQKSVDLLADKKNFGNVIPLNYIQVNDSLFSISWSKSYTYDQYVRMKTVKAGANAMGGGIYGGLIGAGVGAGISSAMGMSVMGTYAWVNYFPLENKITESVSVNPARKDEFYTFPYMAFEASGNPYLVFNKGFDKGSNDTQACFFNMKDDGQINSEEIMLKLKANSINLVHAGSVYSVNDLTYFLVENAKNAEHKYYLLKIK